MKHASLDFGDMEEANVPTADKTFLSLKINGSYELYKYEL